MRCILIDSENHVVKEGKIEGDTLKYMQHAVGGLITIGVILNDQNDTIMVDDEGLLKSPQHFFEYEGAHQPFAGNGIIVGCDDMGDTVDCGITLEEAKSKIKFMSLKQIRLEYGGE